MVRDGVLRRVVLLLAFVVVAGLLGAGSSRAADPPQNPNPPIHPNLASAWPDVGWLVSVSFDCELIGHEGMRNQCKKYGPLGTPPGFLGLDGRIHCEVLPPDHKLAKKCDPNKIRKEITSGRTTDPPPPAPPKPPPDPRLPVVASQLKMAWPEVSWINFNTIDCVGSSPEVYDQCRRYGLLTPPGFLGWDGKVHCEKLPEGHALVGNCDPVAIRMQITGGRTADPNVVAPSSQPDLRKVFEGLSKAWPTVTWVKNDTVMDCGPKMPVPSSDWNTCNYFGRYPGLLGADGNVHCEVIPKGEPLAATCDPVRLKAVLLDKSGRSVNIDLGDFVPDVVEDAVKTIVTAPGKLLKLPGVFAGWLMKKGLDQLVRAAAESAATLFAKVANFIFKVSAPNLQGVAFMRVYNAVSAVMLALVFVLFVAAVLFNMVSDKFGHLPASVGGLIRAVLGICLAAKVADLMVQLSDDCTTSLLGSDAAKLSWSSQAFADQLGDMAGSSGMAIVVLLASIFAIIGLIALMVIMLVRSIEMYAGALFGAIAMVGQAHPHTRSWARKWFWNFTALAWSKFVIAALWLLAGNLITQGDSLVAVLSGIGMIWIMVYSPFALMKMFSFIDAQSTGIGSGVGGRMANAAKDAAFGGGGEDDSTAATPAGGENSQGASPASQMDANVADVESGMAGETGGDDGTDMGEEAAGSGADGSTDPLGASPGEGSGSDPDESQDVLEEGTDPDSLNPGGDMADEAMGPLAGGAGPGSAGSSSEDEQMSADVALVGAGAGVGAGSAGAGGGNGAGGSGGGAPGGSAPSSSMGVTSGTGSGPPSDPVPGTGHNGHSGEQAWG